MPQYFDLRASAIVVGRLAADVGTAERATARGSRSRSAAQFFLLIGASLVVAGPLKFSLFSAAEFGRDERVLNAREEEAGGVAAREIMHRVVGHRRVRGNCLGDFLRCDVERVDEGDG
eukprot:scaffold21451_cov115-Isochrysis_galbana.AAC.1